MPDTFHDHLEMDVVESYVAGELTETELAPAEEHLLVCEMCRQAVSEMDVFAPLLSRPAGAGSAAYQHATLDGPVTLEIRSLPDSRWAAWIHGSRLDGLMHLGSPREACVYLRRSFAEMFPEHLCHEGCGPVD